MHAVAIFLNGPVSYAPMMTVQDELLQRRIADEIPDTVLFLEHTATVTLGRRGRDNFLRLSDDEYARRDIALHHATRGGDVTFHGPGQLVIYPIIRLGEKEADAHGYLSNLEETAIRTAADFGISAFRRQGKSGAWTDHGKIAAIGFRLKRWVTSHGMSLNIHPDLSGFDTIVPCGLIGEPVASFQRILPEPCPSLHQVRNRLAHHFAAICDRPLTIQSLDLSSTHDPDILLRQIVEAIEHAQA